MSRSIRSQQKFKRHFMILQIPILFLTEKDYTATTIKVFLSPCVHVCESLSIYHSRIFALRVSLGFEEREH